MAAAMSVLIVRESRGLRGLVSPLLSAVPRRCATFIVNRPSTSCCRRFCSVSGRSLGCRFKDRRPRLRGFRLPRDDTPMLWWLAALRLLADDAMVAVEERHEVIRDRRLEARLLTREDLSDAGESGAAVGVCDTGLQSPHREGTSSLVRPEEDDDEDEDASDL